jgi:hypothetical protein
MPTPEERKEVIRATGMCLVDTCKAHDHVIDKIIAYKDAAVQAALNKLKVGPDG